MMYHLSKNNNHDLKIIKILEQKYNVNLPKNSIHMGTTGYYTDDYERVICLRINQRDLQEFPEEIFELDELQELHLAGNNIEFIPSRIGTLKKLKKLYLTSNEIKELPTTLSLLKSLTSLRLSVTRRTKVNSFRPIPTK